jgi:hypothetical protein
METILEIIRKATDALPDPADVLANEQKYAARDWAALLAVLKAFMAKLLPLLVPLLVAARNETK